MRTIFRNEAACVEFLTAWTSCLFFCSLRGEYLHGNNPEAVSVQVDSSGWLAHLKSSARIDDATVVSIANMGMSEHGGGVLVGKSELEAFLTWVLSLVNPTARVRREGGRKGEKGMCPILNSLTCSSYFSVVGCTIFFFFFLLCGLQDGQMLIMPREHGWILHYLLLFIIYFLLCPQGLIPWKHSSIQLIRQQTFTERLLHAPALC